ncbi:MAG: cheY40H-4 [Nitrospirae bacterium]|nr:cheY40H-4 [Nitrospirota bacterium]
MPEYNFLVVEDSPTMRQLITFALKRIPGSRIVEANDGIDALKKLSSQKFDIILTDINMPIMDGLKLVSMVRNDPVHRAIPIIIITTEGERGERDHQRQARVVPPRRSRSSPAPSAYRQSWS